LYNSLYKLLFITLNILCQRNLGYRQYIYQFLTYYYQFPPQISSSLHGCVSPLFLPFSRSIISTLLKSYLTFLKQSTSFHRSQFLVLLCTKFPPQSGQSAHLNINLFLSSNHHKLGHNIPPPFYLPATSIVFVRESTNGKIYVFKVGLDFNWFHPIYL